MAIARARLVRAARATDVTGRSALLPLTVSRRIDVEEGVELGELEKGPEVLVEILEEKLSAVLANLLGQRDEDAESGAVDVAGVGEVDDEAAPTSIDLVQHGLLELATVRDHE